MQRVVSCVVEWAHALFVFHEENDRVEKMAENILINDALIDNRLSDVHTVCNFRMFSREESRRMKRAKSRFMQLWLRFRYGFANALRGMRMLFSLTFLKTPLFCNADSGPRLVPKYPESIWLNWATALVAQAGWMLCETAHTEPPFGEYEKRRDYWAEQVLLSAAIHTRRVETTTNSANTNSSESTVPFNGRRCTSELLGIQDWRKYPKLCGGQFCKQEFLKRACRTGNGLPYHVGHRKV